MEAWRRSPSQTTHSFSQSARNPAHKRSFWPDFRPDETKQPPDNDRKFHPRSHIDTLIAAIDVPEILDRAPKETDVESAAKIKPRSSRIRNRIVGAGIALTSLLSSSCDRWTVGQQQPANLPNPPVNQLYRDRPEVYTALNTLTYAETVQVRDILTNASVSVARHNPQTGNWDMGGGVIIRTVNNPGIAGIATAGHLFTDDPHGGHMTEGEIRNYDAVSIWPRSNSSNPLPQYSGIQVAVAMPVTEPMIAGSMNDVVVVYPPFVQSDFQQQFNRFALPLRRTKVTKNTILFRIPFNTGVTNELVPLKYVGEYEGMYVTEDDLVYNPAIERCNNGDSGGVLASVVRRGGGIYVEVAGIYVAKNATQCFASPVHSESPIWNPATSMG